MKTVLKMVFAGLIILSGCGKSGKETASSADSTKVANQALYDRTMEIHDEVMPKMDNLYKLKKSLKDTLANNPTLPAETKKAYEAHILRIDSASNAMMVWMREFNPSSADSLSSESYRAYMERELEKVEKVRAVMLKALEKDND
jgi:hypothetical protein